MEFDWLVVHGQGTSISLFVHLMLQQPILPENNMNILLIWYVFGKTIQCVLSNKLTGSGTIWGLLEVNDLLSLVGFNSSLVTCIFLY